MGTRRFDEKFGADLLAAVSTGPGVYRYSSEDGRVLYVGKAKNLRKRLQGYRNASRKKVHRKMLRIVDAAAALSIEELETEEAALLRENELIRTLQPEFNVEGAFAFLYPAVGFGHSSRHTLLCFTTRPEEYQDHALNWFGTFRSRPRVKLAFDALVDLLGLVAHPEKRAGLPEHPALRGSRFVGLRRVPMELKDRLPGFLAGDEGGFLGDFALLLLTKTRARRDAKDVEEKLGLLADFYESDAKPLRATLRKLERKGTFVDREERDALFIRART